MQVLRQNKSGKSSNREANCCNLIFDICLHGRKSLWSQHLLYYMNIFITLPPGREKPIHSGRSIGCRKQTVFHEMSTGKVFWGCVVYGNKIIFDFINLCPLTQTSSSFDSCPHDVIRHVTVGRFVAILVFFFCLFHVVFICRLCVIFRGPLLAAFNFILFSSFYFFVAPKTY